MRSGAHTNQYYLIARAAFLACKRALLPPLVARATTTKDAGALPDFIIVGAMKSGTTSLYSYLSQHPGMLPAIEKEVQYFPHFQNYSKGDEWYRSHFPTVSKLEALGAQLHYPAITGEASPSMHLHAYAINAAQLLPNAKIIMVLRTPADRAYSHYQHNIRSQRIPAMSFAQALQIEKSTLAPDILNNESHPNRVSTLFKLNSYVHRGKYYEQIQRWLRYYSREQLLILNFDDLVNEPVSVCNQVANFLGLPPFDFKIDSILNQGQYTEPIDDEINARLTNYFRPYNQQLFEFLGEKWGWPT